MARKYAPRTVNIQHYNRIMDQISKAADGDDQMEFLKLIGYITTRFEHCEALMSTLLREVTEDKDLLRILFSVINSRSTRNQVIVELIEAHRPLRKDKVYDGVAAAFKRYSDLGLKRDEVAHSTLVQHYTDDRKMMLLQPAWHVERKHIGGLPKFHYDIPKLEALAEEINSLLREMKDEVLQDIFYRNHRRQERARRAQAARQPSGK